MKQLHWRNRRCHLPNSEELSVELPSLCHVYAIALMQMKTPRLGKPLVDRKHSDQTCWAGRFGNDPNWLLPKDTRAKERPQPQSLSRRQARGPDLFSLDSWWAILYHSIHVQTACANCATLPLPKGIKFGPNPFTTNLGFRT